MPDVYSRIAGRYDRMHRRWLRHAGGAAQAAFEASVVARLRPGIRMLDAGCGTGEFARFLTRGQKAEIDLTLFDASPEMLRQASDVAADHRLGCLCNMPFKTGTFDLVTAAWSIEATEDHNRALKELMRVLRPGGTLIMVFCARGRKVATLARALQATIELRGTGRFLDADAIASRLTALGAEGLRHLRVDGPAAVMTCEKHRGIVQDIRRAA